MEVIILSSPEAVSQMGGRILAHQIARCPASVLGLATGQTMVGVYRYLVEQHCQRGLDFSALHSFNLDEYVGLGPSHPCSYHSYMAQQLFNHINIERENTHIPDGLCSDVMAHCREYEQAITAAGGIDLQLLGLGDDGHIGFNEPSSSLSSRMRIKTLTPMTRRVNRREFPPGESTPLHVLTLGVANIMEARHCLLLAFGANKAPAVQTMVEGPINAMCPASVLQQHPHCTLVIDEAAGAFLQLADYFRFVYEHKPAWQRALLEGSP
ncbi:glucosamine-6-phosphate deaminase [bacterium]|nr:glucosamine-6-phosphate deaminase [bacterium]